MVYSTYSQKVAGKLSELQFIRAVGRCKGYKHAHARMSVQTPARKRFVL